MKKMKADRGRTGWPAFWLKTILDLIKNEVEFHKKKAGNIPKNPLVQNKRVLEEKYVFS